MAVLKLQSPLTTEQGSIRASLSDGFKLQIDSLEPWLCRVAILPDTGLKVPNTWMVAPDGDVPWTGRCRLARDGFSCPELSLQGEGVVGTESIRIEVAPDHMALTFKVKSEAGWQTMLQDRPMAAYRYLAQRGLMQHAQSRSLDAMHLGLGDKAGTIDRTGKRFRCLQTDALGYNAETSDPLYKHVPWMIVGNANNGYCGIFYDTMAECEFDLGAEHSNYHAHYRTVESHENALIYYVISGPTLQDIVPRFQRLVGRPHLQPRWASGFAHTSMHHADANNAQEVMTDFIEQCKTREIPISALHSGSGYTTREDGRRYVFTWNTNKFPDKKAFFQQVDRAGLYSCANIKPVLLKEHPLFNDVASFNGFVTDGQGQPAIEMFWGGPGASLDFTNPATVEWWQKGVKEQVIGAGFTSTWNDNNECEIWDEEARLHGFGNSLKAMDVRPVQAILMLRASFEAALQLDEKSRPYIISRGGPVGLSRYAQTWSGDNYTSWHTLKWNLANGLSMSLSGFPLVGHDIGGFVGPKPDEELLCRWFEMMALHPRAVMNSWKPELEDPASVPWMHESVTDLIRDVLKLRYQFLPWLYHLGWQSHKEGTPVITPMLYYFDDAMCQTDNAQFMLGETVLVAPVVEPGAVKRDVYLPVSEGGWYEWKPCADNEAQWHTGGKVVTISAPLGSLPVFIRAGAILPIATQWDESRPHNAKKITLTYFAHPKTGNSEIALFYDDGLTWEFQKEQGANVHVRAESAAASVFLKAVEQWQSGDSVAWEQSVIGLGDRALE